MRWGVMVHRVMDGGVKDIVGVVSRQRAAMGGVRNLMLMIDLGCGVSQTERSKETAQVNTFIGHFN